MRRPLSRRTVLRGLLGGSAISIGLPAFEAFLNTNGTAYASGEAFPVRFGVFFWGNGIVPERWLPTATGADWELTEELMPLAPVRNKFTLVSGMEVKVPNNDAHFSGAAGFLSGSQHIVRSDSFTFAAASIDQVVANAIGGSTRFKSLEVAPYPGTAGLSFNGPDSQNPPETDPAALFERLFGASFRLPGEDPISDPTLALRRSILDSVMADAANLEKRLGAVDRARLDQHLTSVRELELRIARIESDPPQLDACARPDTPVAVPDIDGRPQMRERAAVVSELVTMALACDLTRSVSYWQSDPLSDILYTGLTAGHHQLTHDDPDDMPQVNQVVLTIIESFNDFLVGLDQVAEGDETLLDHCAILGTTDVSYGRTHQIDEFPILVAGSACGRLKMGEHYRSETKESTSKVALSLLRAVGVNAGSFGTDDAFTEDSLTAIEV